MIPTISCDKATISNILLHYQLRHFHSDIVKYVAHSMTKSLIGLSTTNLGNSHQLAKAHRLPLQHVHVISTCPFDIIHVDLCGPSSMNSAQGMIYFHYL